MRTIDPEPATKILVGIDSSEHSAEALAWALEQSRLSEAETEVILAWLPPSVSWAAPFPVLPEVDLAASAEKVADDAVAEALALVEPSSGFIPEVSVKAVEGSPASVLPEAATSAALLVVGSRGHGPLTGALLGSVSGRYAAEAPRPVVIVHGTVAKSSSREARNEVGS